MSNVTILYCLLQSFDDGILFLNNQRRFFSKIAIERQVVGRIRRLTSKSAHNLSFALNDELAAMRSDNGYHDKDHSTWKSRQSTHNGRPRTRPLFEKAKAIER